VPPRGGAKLPRDPRNSASRGPHSSLFSLLRSDQTGSSKSAPLFSGELTSLATGQTRRVPGGEVRSRAGGLLLVSPTQAGQFRFCCALDGQGSQGGVMLLYGRVVGFSAVIF
jgi:hypothetical protein